MTEFDHSISDQIEKQTGDYINAAVVALKETDFDKEQLPEFVITSLNSFLYQYSRRDLIKDISLIPRIQSALLESALEGEFYNIVEEASNIIKSSPVADFDLIVYRGLASDLKLVPGQLFNHKSFLYCSLHESFAAMFMLNTTDCYSAGGTFSNSKSSECVGTMLKIRVPSNTHYFETKINFNYPYSGPRSEIVLDRGTLLRVESVQSKNGGKYNLVMATIVKE